MNRFYCLGGKMASEVMADRPMWAKPTLEEAVRQAQEIFAKDQTKTELIIVQAIRLVRRCLPEVEVTDLTSGEQSGENA